MVLGVEVDDVVPDLQMVQAVGVVDKVRSKRQDQRCSWNTRMHEVYFRCTYRTTRQYMHVSVQASVPQMAGGHAFQLIALGILSY